MRTKLTASIPLYLDSTVQPSGERRWRFTIHQTFARAAEWLSRLAIEAAGLCDDAWLKMQPHYGGWAKQAMAGSDQSSGAGRWIST
jgi:hypothetical protein